MTEADPMDEPGSFLRSVSTQLLARRAAVALLVPLIPLGVVGLYGAIRTPQVFVILPLIYYGLIPLLDHLIGRDQRNLSAAEERAALTHPLFRQLLYLAGGLYALSVLAVLITAGVLIGEVAYGWLLVLMIGASLYHGAMILVAHELGHARKRTDTRTARALLTLIGYGHFTLEHNAGHHVHVATQEDCASARQGESLYAFALRELPGAVSGAIALQTQRLVAQDRGFWDWRNPLLQSWGLSLALILGLTLVFGWLMLPLLVLHHFGSWFMLTKANYVEHYGLGRKRSENGRYEPVRPHHSWNSDYLLSNALTFNLQRHSDHHAHASRPYPVLRTSADLPHLPGGYPLSFLIALVPPLWFAIMDPKVRTWAERFHGVINRRQPPERV